MLFTIITVCYKNPVELEATLKSIAKQDCKNYQLIVVDGNSGEMISTLASSYSNIIDTFISEPDKGVYDAMNKGAKAATGDYVIYMNSGDCFYSDKILSTVERHLESKSYVSAIYGDTVTDYGYKQRLCLSGSPESFMQADFYSLSFSHQSIFVNRSLLGTAPFDLSYKVAADFNFLYPLLREHNASLLHLQEPFSIFASGGLSDIDKTILNREIRQVYFNNNKQKLSASFYFFKLITLEKLKKRLRPLFRKLKL